MSFAQALSVSWPDIKTQIASRPGASLQYVQTEDAYYIYLADAAFELATMLVRYPDLETAEAQHASDHFAWLTDFEQNFKGDANKPVPPAEVTTQFEKNDKRLKLAKATGTFDSAGVCVMSIRVPDGGRWIAGGYAIEDKFNFGDALYKVQVVDTDNLLGMGEGAVLAKYHDQDLPEANQGWCFWPEPGMSGGVDLEPIGGYGFIAEGLTLEVHIKKIAESTASKCLVNLWWAKTE